MGLDLLESAHNTKCKNCNIENDAYCKTCDKKFCQKCKKDINKTDERIFFCNFCNLKKSDIVCQTCYEGYCKKCSDFLHGKRKTQYITCEK